MIDAKLSLGLTFTSAESSEQVGQPASHPDGLARWQVVIIVPPVLVLERVFVGSCILATGYLLLLLSSWLLQSLWKASDELPAMKAS